MDDLRATKSEDVGLIVCAISFQDVLPIWSWIRQLHRETGRQRDRRHQIKSNQIYLLKYITCNCKTALCTIVHRGTQCHFSCCKPFKCNWSYMQLCSVLRNTLYISRMISSNGVLRILEREQRAPSFVKLKQQSSLLYLHSSAHKSIKSIIFLELYKSLRP